MAALTKAFIDPAGVPMRAPAEGLALPSMSARGAHLETPGMQQVALLPSAWRPIYIGLGRTFEPAVNEVKPKIPPPPLGRQVLITYPPIYIERPTPVLPVRVRPVLGQIYPDPLSAMPKWAGRPSVISLQLWP